MRPADTSPEAWKIYLECQRRLTPAEKFAQMLGFSGMILRASECTMRRQYPEATDREIFLRLVRLRLGPELFQRAYGTEILADESARSAA
jgi:hypothetical protein